MMLESATCWTILSPEKEPLKITAVVFYVVPPSIKLVNTKTIFYVSLEEEPGQQGGEAVKDEAGKVEDGADAGLQGRGGASVDQHHLVDLLRILVGQEGAEGHAGPSEERGRLQGGF